MLRIKVYTAPNLSYLQEHTDFLTYELVDTEGRKRVFNTKELVPLLKLTKKANIFVLHNTDTPNVWQLENTTRTIEEVITHNTK
jgi:hypothetical protein